MLYKFNVEHHPTWLLFMLLSRLLRFSSKYSTSSMLFDRSIAAPLTRLTRTTTRKQTNTCCFMMTECYRGASSAKSEANWSENTEFSSVILFCEIWIWNSFNRISAQCAHILTRVCLEAANVMFWKNAKKYLKTWTCQTVIIQSQHRQLFITESYLMSVFNHHTVPSRIGKRTSLTDGRHSSH